MEVVRISSVAAKVRMTHQKLSSETTHVPGASSGRAGECWAVHASRAKHSLGAACTKEKYKTPHFINQNAIPRSDWADLHQQSGGVGPEYPRPRYHLVSFPVKKGPLKKTMLKFGEYYGRMLPRREKFNEGTARL